MKWLLVIWSVYLLGLSLFPCSDRTNGCEDDIAITLPAENHNHSEDTDDGCSPFCHCSCCSISLTVYNFGAFTLTSPLAEFKEEGVYRPYSNFYSSYQGTIWQPPKI